MSTPDKPAAENSAARPSKANRGHAYQATITAHFPDAASVNRAREALGALHLDPALHTIQWLERDAVEDKWGDRQPGLAPGVTALIVQIEDATQGEALVELCNKAGALRATFHAAQRMTW